MRLREEGCEGVRMRMSVTAQVTVTLRVPYSPILNLTPILTLTLNPDPKQDTFHAMKQARDMFLALDTQTQILYALYDQIVFGAKVTGML